MESELVKWNSDLKPQPPLGIFGLLKELFKTIKRNRKLMLPVLILVFLLFSFLDIAQIYLHEPVVTHLSSPLVERYQKLVEDLGNNTHHNQIDYNVLNGFFAFLMIKLLVLSFFSVISVVFLIASVYSSSEAYTAKVQNVTETLMKIKRCWIKPIYTSFYMLLINMGSIFLCICTLGVASILALYLWAYIFYGVVFLFIVLWIHVFALWMMSLVVSVLEDSVGLDSIIRARELMKGVKMKASLLMGLFVGAYFLVDWMLDAILIRNLQKWPRTVISIVWSNGLLCALEVFVFVVFTIFYHQQKASCDQKAAKSH